jgi:hypothetical protein
MPSRNSKPPANNAPDPAALANSILSLAQHQSATEMDLLVGFEELIRPLLGTGVTLARYSQATKLGGIKDALHGGIVIEYERPGKLKRRAGLEEAIGQLKRYLTEEAIQHGDQAAAALRRMVGVGTDGREILFVRYRGSDSAVKVRARNEQLSFFPEAESAEFSVEGPHPISRESVEMFLGYLQSLAKFPLTAETLAATFGPKSDIAQGVVGILYNKLLKSKARRVRTFFTEWQRIFGIVYGQEIHRAEGDAKLLAKQFGVQTVPRLKEFLFSVHTYFGLLMKLLAAELMTLQRGSMLHSFIRRLEPLNSKRLKDALKELEEGGVFSSQGITNFLEGDFFAWYLSEWDRPLAQQIRGLVRQLAAFDPRTPYLVPEQSRDLLKKLYQYLVPKKLRHDLGEFYTPDWLAEHLVNQLGYDGNTAKRFLDPACGSGTFLVEAINRMKKYAADQDPPVPPEKVAEAMLRNLCGFDLNPIAVIAARTNFLLAMGEFLRYVRPIEIPVYMCDSVLTPSEHAELFGKGYRIPTSVGEFEIPAEVIQADQMEKLASLLEQCVQARYSPKEFTRRAVRELALRFPSSVRVLRTVYSTILKLERQNRNGIWARWLKNAFAPVFRGRFDYIAGNPPWISWESLSKEYRAATANLWAKYGLVPKAGSQQFELGKAKLEFATLFVYSSMHAYLEPDGKLGFLIPQTTFKTKSSEGFRRFQLTQDIPLRVLVAEDLVDIQPFEAASNWTGLVVIQRGQQTSYPVRYVLWHKEQSEAFQTSFTLKDALKGSSRHELVANPVDPQDVASPWLSLPPRAYSALKKVLGKSPYTARAGLVTWADGIYWVDAKQSHDGLVLISNLNHAGKRDVPAVERYIEPDYLHPFIRWESLGKWHAEESHQILLPHTAETGWRAIPESDLKVDSPQTYLYFKKFEKILLGRSGYQQLRQGEPFYICSNTGPWLFAPFKVAWRTMAAPLQSCVISDAPGKDKKRPMFKNTIVFVALEREDEAHFLCACVNSSCLNLAAQSYSVGKSFGSPHLLQQVAIPRFDHSNPTHRRLSELSLAAHELGSELARGPDNPLARSAIAEIERQIDTATGELWGFQAAELDSIQSALSLITPIARTKMTRSRTLEPPLQATLAM